MQKLLYSCLAALFLTLAACAGDTGDSHADSADSLQLDDQQPEVEAGFNTTIVADERVGDITAATGPEDLRRIYGAQHVTDTSVYVGEGFSRPGAMVFPGTPDQVEIIWLENEQRPELVRIAGAAGRWKTSTGVTVGMPLDEVVRINGAEFKFYGFDWDYGGTVSDWQGGELQGLGVRLDYNGELPAGLMGDREIATDAPAVRDADIFVREMIVGLNPPAE